MALRFEVRFWGLWASRLQAILASANVPESERGHSRLGFLEDRKRAVPSRGSGTILVLVFHPLAVAAIEAIAYVHPSPVHGSGVENVKWAHEGDRRLRRSIGLGRQNSN
jgi:hypothetical protein